MGWNICPAMGVKLVGDGHGIVFGFSTCKQLSAYCSQPAASPAKLEHVIHNMRSLGHRLPQYDG